MQPLIFMQLFENHKKNSLRAMSFSLMCLSCTSTMAMSRMGSAIITESNGYPCFSIQSDAETKDGLQLDGIVVSETRLSNAKKLSEEFWHFMTGDSLQKTIFRPTECVRYGEAPQNAIQRTLKNLEVFRVYSVNVIAHNENSNTVAYSGKFCLTSDKLGKITVQSISNDERDGDKRYEVCARPK